MKSCTSLLVAVFAVAVAASELPPPWSAWRYSRPVEMPASETPGFVRLTLPVEVYDRAQESLADLRLLTERGEEVPYLLDVRRGRESRQRVDATLMEVSFVASGEGAPYTQALVDLGASRHAHNALELSTPEKNFFVRAEVAVHDVPQPAAPGWRIVKVDAPLYRFSRDSLPGNRSIAYPDSQARYLRLRMRGGDETFPVHGVRVAYEVVEEAELVPVRTRSFTRLEEVEHRSRWRIDLRGGGVPVSMVHFAVAQAQFHRPVEVYASDDGQTWRRVGAAAIHRGVRGAGSDASGATPLAESLDVEFTEARGRSFRVEVLDRNDPPLDGVRIELWGTPRHLVFRQAPDRRYRLAYGNPRAAAPQYELAQLTRDREIPDALPASLGAEALNPAWVDPRAWSERHPLVLWVALGMTVLVLAALALRALRR